MSSSTFSIADFEVSAGRGRMSVEPGIVGSAVTSQCHVYGSLLLRRFNAVKKKMQLCHPDFSNPFSPSESQTTIAR